MFRCECHSRAKPRGTQSGSDTHIHTYSVQAGCLQAYQDVMPKNIGTPEQLLRQYSLVKASLQGDDLGLCKPLASLTLPLLYLSGGQEQGLGRQFVYEKAPSATLVAFKDSGHAAMLQHSIASAGIISAFHNQVAADLGG